MLSIVNKCWENLYGMLYQNHVILDKFLLLDHICKSNLYFYLASSSTFRLYLWLFDYCFMHV